MSAAVMHPHRKPLPAGLQVGAPAASMASMQPPMIPPMSSDRSASMYSKQQPQQQREYQQQQQPPQQYQVTNNPSRRTLSNVTSSTMSAQNPQRASTHSSIGDAPRRSTSSRSNSSSISPTSYVALMRKQKATVWCDRAQHEDPRLLAAQRQAKERAAKEVAGSAYYGRASTSTSNLALSGGGLGSGLSSGAYGGGGIRSKIRHHGAPKASTFMGGGNLNRAGVPMRLSATEVDDENESDDSDSKYAYYHTRNGSARGSMGSNHARGSMLGSTPAHANGSNYQRDSRGAKIEAPEDPTPVPGRYDDQAGGYFVQRTDSGNSSGGGTGEEDDEEEEQRFGQAGGLPPSSRAWAEQAEAQRKTSEELRRRGSVDDRTMTMSSVRLFVANPDLSD